MLQHFFEERLKVENYECVDSPRWLVAILARLARRPGATAVAAIDSSARLAGVISRWNVKRHTPRRRRLAPTRETTDDGRIADPD